MPHPASPRAPGAPRPRPLLLAALVAALVAGATAAPAQTPVPNVVAGTVRTAAGRPVAGATIRISGSTGAGRGTTIRTTTDARGQYRVAVPLGHYDVDGFADVRYDGQTYRELWLDRTDAGCGRVTSDRGIVRHFVLRLSGAKRCINGPDPDAPGSYHGAYLTAMTGALPAAAQVVFTLQPLGPLADGSAGRTLAFTRTGAALARGGGPIGETAFLHDIPLGRYRVTAAVREPGGRSRPLLLELAEGGAAGESVDVAFPAGELFPYGIRSVGLRLRTSVTPVVNRPPAPPAPAPDPGAGRAALPVGRYACAYRSPYAGDIPVEGAVTIVDAGRYQAYGAAGTYAADAASGGVRWLSGPLAAAGVRARVGERGGRPAITVIGGPAARDPDQTHVCVLAAG